jgi:hypothetical protein
MCCSSAYPTLDLLWLNCCCHHCCCCCSHYLNHEDLGCMKVLQWKCPGYDWVQPASGICTNFKYPVPGAVPNY